MKYSGKLVLGIFCLCTGFLTPIGAGLIALYIWEEYKVMKTNESGGIKERYINPSVAEEFR